MQQPNNGARFQGALVRARRELCGLTVEELADMCRCAPESIRALEDPAHNAAASPAIASAVMGVLTQLEERLGSMLDYVMDAYEDFTATTDSQPRSVFMPYYRSQAEYDAYGRDAGCYSFANAVTRTVLAAFDDFGVPVELYYPADDAERHRAASLSRKEA